jgi:hypothetical protein
MILWDRAGDLGRGTGYSRVSMESFGRDVRRYVDRVWGLGLLARSLALVNGLDILLGRDL